MNIFENKAVYSDGGNEYYLLNPKDKILGKYKFNSLKNKFTTIKETEANELETLDFYGIIKYAKFRFDYFFKYDSYGMKYPECNINIVAFCEHPETKERRYMVFHTFNKYKLLKYDCLEMRGSDYLYSDFKWYGGTKSNFFKEHFSYSENRRDSDTKFFMFEGTSKIYFESKDLNDYAQDLYENKDSDFNLSTFLYSEDIFKKYYLKYYPKAYSLFKEAYDQFFKEIEEQKINSDNAVESIKNIDFNKVNHSPLIRW